MRPRLVALVVSLVPFVATVTLWVRSYDAKHWFGSIYTRFSFVVADGQVELQWDRNRGVTEIVTVHEWLGFSFKRSIPYPPADWSEIDVSIPFWFLALALAVPAYYFYRSYVSYLRRSPIKSAQAVRVCPNCGYDLRTTANQCPECGTMFEGGSEKFKYLK